MHACFIANGGKIDVKVKNIFMTESLLGAFMTKETLIWHVINTACQGVLVF